YQLDDGAWQNEGTFLDLTPGEHTVTVRDTNGCEELHVIYQFKGSDQEARPICRQEHGGR
ncbi:MAG: hypothetical protein AAF624_13740, partial [Bacteroidota bacterium]